MDHDASETRLSLSTSGGMTAEGAALNPSFFAGFLERPEQAAAAMLACARVARTRYYVPPGMLAAILQAADPVVTSNEGTLRFESFSACCGVYARFDLLPEALDGQVLASGTTNVDFNQPMRQALAGIGMSEPLHLQVGSQHVTVKTLDADVVERKVPLPGRWLKGFAEVQVVAARMQPALELSGVEARRFLRSLPRSSRGALWVVPNRSGARLMSKPTIGAVCLAGPERLRALESLVQFASGLRAYGATADTASSSAASTWELECEGARFVLVLSPEVSRGFSGEGGILFDLADDTAAEDANLICALLAWEPQIDVGRLAIEAAIGADRVRAALAHLGAAGRVGYDLAVAAFFHRELPFDPAALEALHPRLADARRLVDAGAVQLTADGSFVTSKDVVHRVVLGLDGDPDRCTCPWWGKHAGTRGPCKHVLATRLAAQG